MALDNNSTTDTLEKQPRLRERERERERERGQTEPGLVEFYDTRPGNGAGLFLEPRSPHWPPTPTDNRA